MISIAKPIIGDREKQLVNEVLDSGMLAQGPKVKELEEKFAQFCGVNHAVAFSNGTTALHAGLYALGVQPDDEVITVPFTFVATANAILMQGAKVVFCDVNPETFTIDVDAARHKITSKTKAIIAVDLYGQPANYSGLRELCAEKGIRLLEDAAQSHDAEWDGKKTGALADIAAFSFYATKNMMCGEGGMVTTDNEEYAELCKRFRHHGQSEATRYEYHDIGYNYRLTDLLAAIALAQLEQLPMFSQKRIAHAKALSDGLRDLPGIKVPVIDPPARHVYHQYTITCDNVVCKRDALLHYLKEHEIGAAVYYPKPLHLHPHFARMGYQEGDFPVSEHLSKSVLSLPVHPLLTESDITKIITIIQQFSKEN